VSTRNPFSPSLIWRRIPPTFPPIHCGPFPHGLCHGQAESFACGFLQHNGRAALQCINQIRVFGREHDNPLVHRTLDGLENNAGLRIIERVIAA
jgi:hypothetical protein